MGPDHLLWESQTWDIKTDQKLFIFLEVQTYGMGNKLLFINGVNGSYYYLQC